MRYTCTDAILHRGKRIAARAGVQAGRMGRSRCCIMGSPLMRCYWNWLPMLMSQSTFSVLEIYISCLHAGKTLNNGSILATVPWWSVHTECRDSCDAAAFCVLWHGGREAWRCSFSLDRGRDLDATANRLVEVSCVHKKRNDSGVVGYRSMTVGTYATCESASREVFRIVRPLLHRGVDLTPGEAQIGTRDRQKTTEGAEVLMVAHCVLETPSRFLASC